MPPRRDPVRDDEIVHYLLGELPEDDAERLDELSVTDEEFAVRLRQAEDDLIDAYSSGRLAANQVQRFESFYLASPRRREKVAFAKRLLETVEREVGRREPAPAAVRAAGRGTARWFPWTLAASVALCLLTGWMFVRDARLRTALDDAQSRAEIAGRQAADLSTELAARQVAAIAAQASLTEARSAQPVALVLLPQTRGVGPVPIVAVPSQARSVPIDLAIDAAGQGAHEAALKDPATNQIIWRSGALPAAGAGPAFVAVGLPADLLKSQHYVVDLFARRPDRSREFVGSYAFEVLRR